MEDGEFIDLVSYRYGVELGRRLARNELMSAVRNTKETGEIKIVKERISQISYDLEEKEETPEKRKELREERERLIEKKKDLEARRKKSTSKEREKYRNFSKVVKYYDEEKNTMTKRK